MNTNNINTIEMNGNDEQHRESTLVARAKFSQLATESPELQVVAIRSEFDRLFAHLEPPVSEMEKEYRLHLFEVRNGYKRSRYAFGEALHTYWFWSLNTKQEEAKSAQKTTFENLCTLIGVERRTGYNIMDDYKRAKNVHSDFRAVAGVLNIDLAERRNADLVGLLTAHPDLPRTENVQDKAAAVFQKAQENVAMLKKEREEKARAKTKYTKLLDFVADLYKGAPVPELRRDIDLVIKYLTSYSRADDTVPSLKEAHEKNRAKAA